MKLTKQQLRQIIREEIEMTEGFLDFVSRTAAKVAPKSQSQAEAIDQVELLMQMRTLKDYNNLPTRDKEAVSDLLGKFFAGADRRYPDGFSVEQILQKPFFYQAAIDVSTPTWPIVRERINDLMAKLLDTLTPVKTKKPVRLYREVYKNFLTKNKIKLTNSQLEQIIEEELKIVLKEYSKRFDPLRYNAVRLPNNFIRIRDKESGLVGLYNSDLTYRSGFNLKLASQQIKQLIGTKEEIEEKKGMFAEPNFKSKVTWVEKNKPKVKDPDAYVAGALRKAGEIK